MRCNEAVMRNLCVFFLFRTLTELCEKFKRIGKCCIRTVFKAGYTRSGKPVRYACAGTPVRVYRMPVVHPHAPVNLSGFTVIGWPSPWHASVCLHRPLRHKNIVWLFTFVPVTCACQNNCAVLSSTCSGRPARVPVQAYLTGLPERV